MEKTIIKTEINLKQIIQTLEEILPQIKREYQIKKLGIFGSYVRGEATPESDIDLLIEFNQELNFGLITFCQLENKLSTKLGKKVDLVIKDNLKPYLSQNILSEVIYL